MDYLVKTGKKTSVTRLMNVDSKELDILRRASEYVRRIMVDMIFHANKDIKRRGHYGSSTSSVELYVAQLARIVNPYRDFIGVSVFFYDWL